MAIFGSIQTYTCKFAFLNLRATSIIGQDINFSEDGASDELDRLLKIFLNIMICVMHFIREAFHHSTTSMKFTEGIIQHHILNASYAHTQHEFFEEI